MKVGIEDLPPISSLDILPVPEQQSVLFQKCAADIMAAEGISQALAEAVLADPEATRLVFKRA